MKKYILILITIAAVGFTSCEKWLDVNKNPNDATVATPDDILPGVLTTWASQVSDLNTTVAAWMGYWSHAGGWSGWYTTKKYEVTASFYPGAFNGYYMGVLTDTKFIRDNCGDNLVLPAITNVVDAWYMSRLVDLYGDVPYSQACDPGFAYPVYDDDQDIYEDLIARLDVAVETFKDAAANPANKIYVINKDKDIIFKGDMNKWKKFANTLKLRLVLRMTNVKSDTELQGLMATTASEGFITETVTANPGYSSSSGKTMPLWNTFGKSYDGIVTSANTQYCLNAYLHRKLAALTDPRLNQFFFPGANAGGTLRSMKFGTDGDLVTQPNTTIVGNYSWIPIANNAVAGSNGASVSGATDPTKIFLRTEASFLQAEAAVRGIISGTAKDFYETGITQSMNDWKITDGTIISDYISAGLAAWNDGDALNVKIAKIIEQKYISNYFLNMFESYNDYRRTGFPNPKKPGTSFDTDNEMLSYYPSGIIRRQIPRLFPYPNEEFTLNKANAEAAVELQNVEFITSKYPFDARVFWDKAPLTIDYNY